MHSPRIRPAVAGDAAAIARLLGQLGYPTDADEIPARLEQIHARPGTTVVVAEDSGGEVVGAVTVHLFQALHTSGPTAWLTAVVVEEKARGRGIGTALVEYAEQWARRHGASRISLTSALHRTAAHEFYKSRQYEHTGLRLSKILDEPAATSRASRPGEFHVMDFDHHDEAAAVVAALSRLLESPRAVAADDTRTVEVWARSPVASEGVRLFLSDSALAAAESGFAPLPVVRTIKRDSLPDESFLIIEGGITPAWGAAEASAKLSAR
jgi:GNAT superfamily N-acetyltransferase